ncbi:MAG: hypothetical protein INR64_18760 [Caulobacteraceae bacterium]|nr:hypothetical protein [Caulobacter sp.]
MPLFRRPPEPPQPPATRLEAGVDRTLAGIGYALIGASLFTVWITGLAAWLIAFTHRKSPDPVARAHFKYQLWVADLAGLAVGIGAALVVSGGAFIVSPFFDGDTPTAGDVGGGVLAAAAGALLFLLAFVGTLVGVGFGAVRLVRGRLVGLRRHEPAAAPAAPPAVRSR